MHFALDIFVSITLWILFKTFIRIEFQQGVYFSQFSKLEIQWILKIFFKNFIFIFFVCLQISNNVDFMILRPRMMNLLSSGIPGHFSSLYSLILTHKINFSRQSSLTKYLGWCCAGQFSAQPKSTSQ